uniref:Uncharacterized protein n=1 Tax=Oncorhynchus kisutch TaxID=8019 RepID=A0A8C7GNN3_ONCKI
MSKVLTVDAILFGLLVFSGILSLYSFSLPLSQVFLEPGAVGSLAQQRERKRVWVGPELVYGVNLAFSLLVLVNTTQVHSNTMVELMVIIYTTRPLLGCVWDFPSEEHGSAFASSSLALNKVAPLVLMVGTNLPTLAKHDGQGRGRDAGRNHNGGHHAEGLLTVSHFSTSLFVGFSPMVVALGNDKLRRVKCQQEEIVEECRAPDTMGKKVK